MASKISGEEDDVAVTLDGCPVELYRRLRAGDEPALIASVACAGASVLDLGSGAGRLAHPLIAAGFVVTAVDQSAEMLAEIVGAERIHSSIEALDLEGRRFDVVLLTSYLLNAPSREARARLLRTCARHLKARGVVFIQLRGRSILEDLSGFRREEDGIVDVVEQYERYGDWVTITWRTEADGRSWRQTFTHEYLSDAALMQELPMQGLRLRRRLGEEWFVAELAN